MKLGNKSAEPALVLLDAIEKIGEFSWRKYRSLFSQVWVVDHFEEVSNERMPPYVSFRFLNENAFAIEKLKFIIFKYRGSVEWAIRKHERINLPGVNWSILPKAALDMESEIGSSLLADKYWRDKNSDFFIPAYEDMFGLANFINSQIDSN